MRKKVFNVEMRSEWAFIEAPFKKNETSRIVKIVLH